MELVEGKDWSKDLGPREIDAQGKTVGLMLNKSKNFWNTGKIGTMDRGFSVAKGILTMREKGIFGQSLVKPRGCGWLVLVPGNYIDKYFVKKIGYCKTLEQVVDWVKFFIHCQKDDKYMAKIMSYRGVLMDVEDHETHQEVVREDRFQLPRANFQTQPSKAIVWWHQILLTGPNCVNCRLEDKNGPQIDNVHPSFKW